jgi:hypothetical protein
VPATSCVGKAISAVLPRRAGQWTCHHLAHTPSRGKIPQSAYAAAHAYAGSKRPVTLTALSIHSRHLRVGLQRHHILQCACHQPLQQAQPAVSGKQCMENSVCNEARNPYTLAQYAICTTTTSKSHIGVDTRFRIIQSRKPSTSSHQLLENRSVQSRRRAACDPFQ